MTFPTVPRELVTDLFLGGRWVNVSGDVRDEPGITITRGRSSNAGRPDPTQCSFALDDEDHNYSPDNPTGIYYGELGIGVPVRVGVVVARDAFGRTVSSGWGNADVGGSYSTAGAGGTVQPSDFNVASGKGTQSVPAVSANRFAYLTAVSYRNIDVRVTFTLAFTDVTGGDVEPANILLRGQSSSHYYMVRVVVTSAEAVTIALQHRATDGTVTALTSAVTVAGLTHSSAQAITVRAQIDGETLMAKAWAATGNEPYDWLVTAYTKHITTAGFVGVRSGVAAANTNTLPVVFSYDDLVVTSWRAHTEISSLAPEWDVSENDEWVAVESAGVMQRLGQGEPPVLSTLYRGISDLATPAVAYWPGEDGAEATAVGSATPGAGSMYVTGDTDFAAYSGFACSAPIPVVGFSAWVGAVPDYTTTGKIQLRYLMHLPSAGIADTSVISKLDTTGSAHHWEVKYGTGGSLKLQCWSSADVLLLDTGFVAFAYNDRNVMLALELTQNGANIDYRLAGLEVGAPSGGFVGGTLNSQIVGKATQVVISPFEQLDGTAIGHINVRKEVVNLFDLVAELNAHQGETALVRFQRLCDQNGIEDFSIDNPEIFSALMGPQRVRPLLDLLHECADADQGTIYETRGLLGLTLRERAATYNQDSAAELDYAARQIYPPFASLRDDRLARNDVTVRRENGGTAREVLETGPMSVLPSSKGGIGRYDTQVTLNVYSDGQLADIAGWLLHVYTVGETRYPTVTVDLAGIADDTTLARGMLDLDLDNRFTVINPKAGQTPDAISQLDRGYGETIKNFEHWIRINAAPESPYQVVEFGGAESRFDDGGTTTLAAGINSSVNSFTVAVGTLWTTDAADLPIEFAIGGEVISVGAVSGASSPQTFSSVTRSVNGVVKSHDAGDAVALARRMTLPL